jgi:(2Fe-2S) ferredoxin
MSKHTKKILVCVEGKTCSSRHSDHVLKGIKKAIDKEGLEDFFKVKKTGCLGGCKCGPIVHIEPEDCAYAFVRPEDCRDIVKRHFKKNKPIKRLKLRKKK